MSARFAFVRIGHSVLSILFLTLFIFALVRITGDPTQLLLPEGAPEEVRARLRADLGLDRPLLEQYWMFVSNTVQGDLGTSFRFQVPVTDLIAQRLPKTVELGIAAIVILLAVAVPLGVYAAYWRGGWVDWLARSIAIVGQSAPSFWIGLLAILLFSVQMGWLPSGGTGSLDHIVLPAVITAWGGMAGLTRLVRSSMIETLETDYVKFLRLKGVPEWSILWKHGLRNSGLSALTFMGVLTATTMTGSIIAETVFVWPGMGSLITESITSKDFAVVQGVVLVFSIIYIVVNLCTDLLYGRLNPRLR